MSSKLVRKGLELVNSEGGPKSKKRKSVQKEKQPSKKRKGNSGASKERQQPRGYRLKGLQLSSGQTKKAQQVDFTEQNLKYFKKATWKIKKDTYNKILERQNKLQRGNNLEEKHEESDTEGGLFDD